MAGKVYLVGAGPGDPELLTIKAVKVLRSADVVLHDELVSSEVLQFASPAATIINVGKRSGRRHASQEEIHCLMIAYAGDGLTVVRLKGGDPLVFGRAGEEIEALRQAGIEFEVVPGVTAALAAAAAAGISLTDRRMASALLFITAHSQADKPEARRSILQPLHGALLNSTLAVYMPGSHYSRLQGDLITAGLPPETPCLIVSAASTLEERIHLTRLDKLSAAPVLPPPRILIAGQVAGGARLTSHSETRVQLVPS
jgi:uroporphyrin-III C-methyltransferase